MSDSQEAGAMADKGKRLASMMSMGFGYFKAKRALEEHDWDVDKAVAGSFSKTKEEKPDSVKKGKSSGSTSKETASVPVPETEPKPKHADEPQLSPDHAAVRSLKRQMPHSKDHERVPADKTSQATAVASGGSHAVASDSSATQEMKRDPPGLKVHESDEDNTDAGTHEVFEEYIEKQEHAMKNANEEENFEENARNVFRSTPGAFREGGDGDATTAWDSLMPESLSTRPLAVAETVSVPELVSATLQEPVMSAVTAPLGNDGSSEAATGGSRETDNKSNEETHECLTKRRGIYVLVAVILAIIGLAVGLAVSQTKSTNESGLAVAAQGNPTPSPTTATPTPEPSTAPPSLSGATARPMTRQPTVSPSEAPTSSTTSPSPASPTQAPTKHPTPAPTQSPSTPQTQPPTTAQSISRPTEPPAVPVTASPTPSPTDSPTSAPTKPPTVPPTVPPTREPSSPPTLMPTDWSVTSPPAMPEDLKVEGAEMVLSGASRLDGDAMDIWSQVTIDVISAHVEQALEAQLERPYDFEFRSRITLDSQQAVNDELTLIFSVEFEIDSSLETHNVKEYVLGAFDTRDKRSEYLDELEDADTSFEDVFDVSVTVPVVPQPTSPSTDLSPPSLISLSIDRAEMVLSGASRLDGDTGNIWAEVTAEFIADDMEQAIRVQLERPYAFSFDLSIELNSQDELDDNELILIFSVDFEIQSSLETHDVDEYFLNAFDSDDELNEYIDKLQAADLSFENVSEVQVFVR